MKTRRVGAIDISEEAALTGLMVCPNCGDTKFGSRLLSDGSLLRTCHGSENDETVCRFQWPASDDHKYFYVPLELVLRLKGDI